MNSSVKKDLATRPHGMAAFSATSDLPETDNLLSPKSALVLIGSQSSRAETSRMFPMSCSLERDLT